MLLVELRVETRRSVPTCAQQNSTTIKFSVKFKALTLRRAQVILLLPQNLLCSLSPSHDEANLSFFDVLKQTNCAHINPTCTTYSAFSSCAGLARRVF